MPDAWQDPPLPECVTRHTDRPLAPAVYAIQLEKPESWEVATERWNAAYVPSRPGWLKTAWDSAEVLYVGGAANVSERVREHIDGHNRSAAIMAVYPPKAVEAVWPQDSPGLAFERESGIALELQNDRPDSYVHQR